MAVANPSRVTVQPQALRDSLLIRALIPHPSPQDAADMCVQVVAGWLRERARSWDRPGCYPADAITRLADELDPP
jgi:hypothetical protein